MSILDKIICEKHAFTSEPSILNFFVGLFVYGLSLFHLLFRILSGQ